MFVSTHLRGSKAPQLFTEPTAPSGLWTGSARDADADPEVFHNGSTCPCTGLHSYDYSFVHVQVKNLPVHTSTAVDQHVK